MPSEKRVEIIIDRNRLEEAIRGKKRVGIAAPDGLYREALMIYEELEQRGYEPILLLDPTYGICDLQDTSAERLDLDVVINIGHTAELALSPITRFVNAEYVYSNQIIDELATKTYDKLNEIGCKRIGVYTINNFFKSYNVFTRALRKLGIEIRIAHNHAHPSSLLREYQVLGCNFYSAWSIRKEIDCVVFFGSSKFHAIGLRLATNRRVLVADPDQLAVYDIEEEARREELKALAAVQLAIKAKTLGIVTGLKSGQAYPGLAKAIGRILAKHGKRVLYLALTEITQDRLRLLNSYVDAYILLACPRIPQDVSVGKPILSYPQAVALISLLSKKEMKRFLDIPVWSLLGYGIS